MGGEDSKTDNYVLSSFCNSETESDINSNSRVSSLVSSRNPSRKGSGDKLDEPDVEKHKFQIIYQEPHGIFNTSCCLKLLNL